MDLAKSPHGPIGEPNAASPSRRVRPRKPVRAGRGENERGGGSTPNLPTKIIPTKIA